MSNPIPVQNIYYLLCYAWNSLEEGETIDVSGIDSTNLVDLFASVLLSGLNHLLRRGLEQGYQTFGEELTSVRGRVSVAISTRRMLLQHGKAYCEYDELTVNTQANRILKTTLSRLTRVEALDSDLKKKIVKVCRDLPEITDIPITRHAFRKIQLHSNSRYYRFLLNVCQLISENLLVDESSGSYRFRDFLRDERKMALLFESFIFNFIKTERPDLNVRKEKIKWDATAENEEDLFYLPNMETDISVRSKEKALIIDAKYYRKTMSSYYESESIHSAHLYQLTAYLKNLEARAAPDNEASGLLLYPFSGRRVDLEYNMQGHSVGAKTLDLSVNWTNIRSQLRQIVDEKFS
ncbi:5-methylcytosine-specific restriction endonuclease system specificity protein McrC [Thermodesulfobacteriota bacterium]